MAFLVRSTVGNCILAFGLFSAAGVLQAEPESHLHVGMSNASAAVPVGTDWFVAASDEDNRLRVYRRDQPGAPVGEMDLTPAGEEGGDAPELDLEGGARVGEYAYWIGSHGRNKDGKKRPFRRRLMATRLEVGGDGVRMAPVGRPYTGLIDDLDRSPETRNLGLREASKKAPEDGGLNIEGLAAGPDGILWIGFRSPLVDGERCLLVPLHNPAEVIGGLPARFGKPVALDLDGRGIRDMVWSGREFFLVAGDPRKGGKSRLYRWAGPGSDPVRIPDTGFKHFNPEAIVFCGDGGSPRLLVLSDDGNRVDRLGTEPGFRSFWVEP